MNKELMYEPLGTTALSPLVVALVGSAFAANRWFGVDPVLAARYSCLTVGAPVP